MRQYIRTRPPRRRPLPDLPSRIMFLALLCAWALTAPYASLPPALAAKKTILALNWIPGGAHVPFFYARDAGFFAKEGLAVEIRSAKGSRDAMRLLTTDSVSFALAEGAELFVHRAGGMDTVGVMVLFDKSPNALLALERPGLRHLADLAGKLVAAPRASFPRILFPELRPKPPLNPSSVRMITLPPGDLLPALLGKRVDAVAASALVAHQYRAAARRRGHGVAVFPYADAGVNPYSLLLVSVNSLFAKDPDLMRAFVRASAAALADAVESPRKAMEVFLKSNPELGRERIRAEWRAALNHIYAKSARRAGLGRFEESRLEHMRALLGRVGRQRFTGPVSELYLKGLIPPLHPTPGKL